MTTYVSENYIYHPKEMIVILKDILTLKNMRDVLKDKYNILLKVLNTRY